MFRWLLLWRVANALFLVRTLFVPDEYFQSLEVARWWAKNGDGYLTWEWRPQVALRSPIYPLLFYPLYRLLATNMLPIAMAQYLSIYGPRMMQAVLAALADWSVYQIARKHGCGKSVAQWALLYSTLSWFNLFASTRTLINSAETALIALTLSRWNFTRPSVGPPAFALLLIATTFVMRPTSALFWVYPLLLMLWLQNSMLDRFKVILKCLTICVPVVFLAIAIDSIFYGTLQVTWWNFVQFNLLRGISEFYGVHQWHWYVSQGLPILLTTFLPLVLGGAYLTASSNNAYYSPFERHALLMAVPPIVAFSLLAHKEYRFLYPLLPLCFISAGRFTHQWADWAWRKRKSQSRFSFVGMIAAVLVAQVTMGVYMGTVHQRGVVDVMQQTVAILPSSSSVLFLMPCHSTPWTSHVNRGDDIQMRFLTCEPPIDSSDLNADEADSFYTNPVRQFHTQNRLPDLVDIIVIFEELLQRRQSNENTTFKQTLHDSGYRLYQRHFNSHFIDDERRMGDVLVFKKS